MSRKHRHRVKRRKDRMPPMPPMPAALQARVNAKLAEEGGTEKMKAAIKVTLQRKRLVARMIDNDNRKRAALAKWIKDRGGRRVYPGEEEGEDGQA